MTRPKQCHRISGMYFVPLLILLAAYFTLPLGASYFLDEKYDSTVVCGFLFNGITWFTLLMLEVKRRAYSLEMIHWSFCLFFFAFAPAAQYAYKPFPWGVSLSDEILFRTNVVLSLWTVCFFAGTRWHKLKDKFASSMTSSLSALHGLANIRKGMPIFTALHVFFAVYRIRTQGFLSIFIRGIALIEHNESSMSLLLSHCFNAYCALLVIICLLLYRTDKKYKTFLVINSLCLLINCFPTTLSRYAMAAIYGSVFLSLFPSLKTNRKFILLFIFAVVIVFPFMNAFRRTAITSLDIGQAFSRTISTLYKVWNSGDYDAYTLLAMTIEYVDEFGPVYGRQLLGVILFWFPRKFWPSKPYGSGRFLATMRGWHFTNISSPLPAEGMMNFWLLGVIAFGLFFGAAISSLDSIYWSRRGLNDDDYTYFEAIYYILMFMFFFMSRGDLQSPTSYTVAFVAVWFALGRWRNIVLPFRS